jgi:uncharacterized protein YdaU (DUF1376 family)
MSRRPSTPQPKPPAMQLYVRDWLASTYGMPLEVKGLHIDLLCIAWDNGALPDDAKWRQRVAGVSASKAAALWAILQNRWKKTRKGWINPRQERQRYALSIYLARAKHASSMRWASPEHDASMPQASPRRMLDRSTSSSSSSSKDLKPAAARPVPFRVYVAIAARVLEATKDLDLDPGALAEELKRAYAKQGLEYHATIVQKAMDAAQMARARRRA